MGALRLCAHLWCHPCGVRPCRRSLRPRRHLPSRHCYLFPQRRRRRLCPQRGGTQRRPFYPRPRRWAAQSAGRGNDPAVLPRSGTRPRLRLLWLHGGHRCGYRTGTGRPSHSPRRRGPRLAADHAGQFPRRPYCHHLRIAVVSAAAVFPRAR